VARSCGTHDAHRIIEGRAAPLFGKEGTLIRCAARPGAPRLALLVKEPVAPQIRLVTDGTMLLRSCGVHTGNTSRLAAFRNAVLASCRHRSGLPPVRPSVQNRRADRGVNAHFKLRMARIEARQPQQEPLLQK